MVTWPIRIGMMAPYGLPIVAFSGQCRCFAPLADDNFDDNDHDSQVGDIPTYTTIGRRGRRLGGRGH
jgi:hypothetical protein